MPSSTFESISCDMGEPSQIWEQVRGSRLGRLCKNFLHLGRSLSKVNVDQAGAAVLEDEVQFIRDCGPCSCSKAGSDR